MASGGVDYCRHSTKVAPSRNDTFALLTVLLPHGNAETECVSPLDCPEGRTLDSMESWAGVPGFDSDPESAGVPLRTGGCKGRIRGKEDRPQQAARALNETRGVPKKKKKGTLL